MVNVGTYTIHGLYGNGKSPFLIGDTSSIRVHFPASYLSSPVIKVVFTATFL